MAEMKERLREFMISKSLNSKQISEVLGVQPSAVSHIINGRNKPSVEFLEKLLKAFPDSDIHWLITGERRAVERMVQQRDSQSENTPVERSNVIENQDNKRESEEITSVINESGTDEVILLMTNGQFKRFREI